MQLMTRTKWRLHLGVPIETLPVELLSSIFLIYVRSYLSRETQHMPPLNSNHVGNLVPKRKEKQGSLVHALHLSQVCRHWRDVAQCTPQLWTNIVFQGPIKRIEHCLQFSRGLPLFVYCRHPFAFSKVLFQQFDRIRYLDITLPENHSTHFQKLLTEEASFLEYLKVSWPLDLDLFRGVQTSPPTQRLPRLTTLDLRVVHPSDVIPWVSSSLRTLSLDVRSIHADVTEVLRAISHLPLLEVLTYHGSTNLVAHPNPTEPIAEFPNLRLLTLEIHESACIAFLQGISFPEATKLQITTYLSSVPAETPVTRIAAQKVLPSGDLENDHTARYLAIAYCDLGVEMSLWDATAKSVVVYPQASVITVLAPKSLHITFPVIQESTGMDGVVEEVCASLPLYNLQGIILQDDMRPDNPAPMQWFLSWWQALSRLRCPTIQNIWMSGRFIAGLPCAFFNSETLAQDLSAISFPGLQHVHMINCDFVLPDYENQAPHSVVEETLQSLERRSRVLEKSPLVFQIMNSKNLLTGDVGRLRGFANVQWE